MRGVVCGMFAVLRENALGAHDITYRYTGHHEKLLCSDNDPRCHLRKMKIIFSDWIALLRRLLILNKFSGVPLAFREKYKTDRSRQF